MTRSVQILVGLFLASNLMGVACAKQSSDAKEAPQQQAQSGSAISGNPGDDQVASAETSVADETPAAKAYGELIVEMRGLERSATTPEKRAQAMAQMQTGFESFVAEYPDSPEAQDARFQLGILYISMMQTDKARDHLADFVEGGGDPANPEKMGYAYFYLAEAYKGADKFAEAKKNYKIFLDRYSHLSPRLVQAAQSGLEDLDALKRLSIGSEPIPFEVTDLDGKKLSLADLKGKVVLLDFWATWCAPCKVEMPNVIKIHKKYHEKGFEIVGISLDQSKAALESYIRSNKMTWPQHFDGRGWQNGLAAKYKVRSIPATFLIDRQGKIRYRSVRGPALEKAVAELVKETS